MESSEKDKQTIIELLDGYVCLVDRLSWTLAKRVVSKSGKESYRYIAYTGSLESVLKKLGEEITVDSMKGGSLTLSDALLACQRSRLRLEKFIEENLPQYEIKKKGE